MLTDLWLRLRAILGFGARDRDLDDELRFHLDHRVEKLVASGMARDEALRRARLEFGGVEQVKEDYRDTRGLPFTEALVDCAREIRVAVRMLAKTPAFTIVAILSLALGIGANAAMFSIVDAELLRPLPVPDAGRVLTVTTSALDDHGSGVSYPNYRDLRDESRSFSGLLAYRRSVIATFAASRTDARQMSMGMLVSENFFDVLQVRPALGRTFAREEGTVPGRDAVVVLGHSFWKNTLGGSPSILGQEILLNGIGFAVIGVAPERFTGMDESIPSFFVPIAMGERLTGGNTDNRGARQFAVKGRLRPGVSPRTAAAELTTLWSGLGRQYPDANRNLTIAVRSQFRERLSEEGPATSITLALMMALVAVVLIIACANVASLVLGRNRARSREIAIRLALGVSRVRLLRQLLIESLVLALAGAALGLGFAFAGVRLLQSMRPPAELRAVVVPQLDERVLIVGLLAAIASAVLCGLAPAWRSLKTDLVPALKNAEPGRMARQRTRGRSALVVTQIALAMVLLVVTVAVLDGVRKVFAAASGFPTSRLLLAKFDTSIRSDRQKQAEDFYRRLEDRARGLPGVVDAALTSRVPLDRGIDVEAVVPEGVTLPRGRETVNVYSAVIDEHYFDVIRIPVVAGRRFTPFDRAGASRVAIINEEFAKTYWPGRSAIGRRLQLDAADGPSIEIVGVAKTSRYLFVAEPPTPFLYLPLAQRNRADMALLLETAGDAASLAGPLRALVHDLDADQPLVTIRTFASFYDERALGPPRVLLRIVGLMGGIGLGLALMGLYGLISYSVARRTKEIGLRMAIGAARSDVLAMVLGQGLKLAAMGIAIGGVASVGVARLLAAGMAGLGPPSVPGYSVVPVALVLLTLAASYLPARRAASVDPLIALRDE